MQYNIITIKIICFIIFINIIYNNKKDATTFTGYSIQTKYVSQSANNSRQAIRKIQLAVVLQGLQQQGHSKQRLIKMEQLV